MEIKKENIISAYNSADENGKRTLIALFGEEAVKQSDNRPVTERVKTFRDACRELGDNHPLVMAFDSFLEDVPYVSIQDADIIAYLKLRIICAALNEGWEPQFTEDEWRYYPWYSVLAKEEWDDLSERQKKERGVFFGGSASNGALGGVVYAYSYCTHANKAVLIGSRLCFKTSELAIYAAKQFVQDWLDFCYLPNTECKPYIDE